MVDWSKYAVGGAQRPDSFTGLNPDFSSALSQMLLAAEADLGPNALSITSAYRSPEKQAELYQAALKKYGSPAAARKWVAPPGRSMHNKGLAVDFGAAGGGLLRDPNSREAQWLKANASKFGLDVPMSWEPWQVELAGAREGREIAADTMQTLGLLTPKAESKPMMQEEKPRGLLGSLGIQKMEEGAAGETGQRFYERETFGDTLANLAPLLGRMGVMGLDVPAQVMADRRFKKKEERQKATKTLEALQNMNTPQAQRALEYLNASNDPIGALKMAFEKPKEQAGIALGDRVINPVTGEVIYNGSTGPDVEDVAKLRKEFTAADEVKTFVPIARQYANIISAASDGTGASDIALVFSYMKLLDPGSSVQQGEQATAANAAGAPSKVRSLYNSIIGGGNLDNTARDQFAAAATNLYENARAPYAAKVDYYKNLATQYGYNPENVVPETAYSGPAYTPWSQRNLAPPAAIEALKANPTPDMRRQFDEKFGAGAAEKALGR